MADTSARLAHIKVLSFDLDDTLWDCAPVIERAERTLYAWMQQNTPRVCDHYTVDQVRDFMLEFAKAHPEYRVDVTYLRQQAIKSLFSLCGYPRDLADPAFAHFLHARSQVKLYADAIEVLELLGKNYRLAALTNGNADLNVIGIARLFQDVQAASLSVTPKPHRMMFDNTATKLGVSLDEILHIGDNPVNDVGGGQNAGTMTVWFNQQRVVWPVDLPRPDFEISSLSQLASLLPLSASVGS